MTAFPRSILQALLILSIMLAVVQAKAQNLTDIVTDTSAKKIETIPLADISVRSAELIVTSEKMMESIIEDDKIKVLDHLNDSLLKIADSLLHAEMQTDFTIKNRRYLNNKIASWSRVRSMLGANKDKIAGIVHSLDEKKYDLEEQVIIWSKTKDVLIDEQPGSHVFTRIDYLNRKLDSMARILQAKSEKVLIILDKATAKGLLVEDQIGKIENELASRTEAIFSISQPPLWQVNLSSSDNTNIIGPLTQFYQMEIRDLKYYFRSYTANIIIEIVLLLFLVVFLQLIKKRIKETRINDESFYQRALVRILLHPVSAALILGVFATILVFPNRPLILRDITIIAAMVPMLLLITTLSRARFLPYYYIVVLLMLLQFVYFIYPPRHLIYHIGMMVMALVELIALASLLKYFARRPFSSRFTDRLVKLLIIVHLGFAFIGFIGLLLGANILAETMLGISVINAFTGILLITAILIVNGMIELGLESKSFKKLNIFRLYGSYLAPRVIRLVNLGAFVFWFFIFMDNLNIDRMVLDKVNDFLNMEINIGSASFTLIGIVIFFLVLWLSIVISKMIRIILEEDVLNRLKLAKGLPHTISVLVRYTIVTVGVMLAVSAAGMPVDNLTIIFGAFGVGIGFGLQNIFNNLVSGLILLFERPIQIGDTIEVGQLMGHVKSIGIRSSNVRTFDGAEVIVPNGQLISNEVVNWTLSDQARRIEVIAGVSYGSDPHKVKALFEKILQEHPDIIQEPEPRVLFNDLGESSLDFRLLFWTSNFDEWLRIRSEVIFSIFDTLKAEGIEIPFPQRDLHLRSIDPKISLK